MTTATREERIGKQMAQYFPGTPVEQRRQWATEHVDREDRYQRERRQAEEFRAKLTNLWD